MGAEVSPRKKGLARTTEASAARAGPSWSRLWTDRRIYSMLRNSASGQEIGLPGRISAGFQSGKLPNQPFHWPKGSRRAEFDAFPTKIRQKRKIGMQ